MCTTLRDDRPVEVRARAELLRRGNKGPFKAQWIQATGDLGYAILLVEDSPPPPPPALRFAGGVLVWVAKSNACVRVLMSTDA